MKVVRERISELVSFGFDVMDDEYIEKNYIKDYDFRYYLEDCYVKFIGFSRRGQAYYYIVDPYDCIIKVYSTRPDGDGGSTELDSTIIELHLSGLIDNGGK